MGPLPRHHPGKQQLGPRGRARAAGVAHAGASLPGARGGSRAGRPIRTAADAHLSVSGAFQSSFPLSPFLFLRGKDQQFSPRIHKRLPTNHEKTCGDSPQPHSNLKLLRSTAWPRDHHITQEAT